MQIVCVGVAWPCWISNVKTVRTRSRDFDILLISIQTAETVHLLYSGPKKIRQ
jgi:hypothetical protein